MFLLARLYFMKKEIKNISTQLESHNRLNSRKKIDVSLFDKEVENLALNINNHIDLHIKNIIEKQKSEEKLKKDIANISHDLRTPLTSIMGYIQIVKTGKVSEEKQKEYLDIAYNRSKYLNLLLNDFFEISVIEAPDYHVELKKLNLNNILCNVMTEFYNEFTQKGIVPKIKLPKESIFILGDELAVKRVLGNLITNITRYGKEKVFVNLEKNNDDVVLYTANSAPNLKGIFENGDANIIFDRFYRGNKYRESKFKSMGLGLSIAKGIMNKMNGEMSAKYKDNFLYIYCNWKVYR